MKHSSYLFASLMVLGAECSALAAEGQHTVAAVGIRKIDLIGDGSLQIEAVTLEWFENGQHMQIPQGRLLIKNPQTNPKLDCLPLAIPAMGELTFTVETKDGQWPGWNQQSGLIFDANQIQVCRLQIRNL